MVYKTFRYFYFVWRRLQKVSKTVLQPPVGGASARQVTAKPVFVVFAGFLHRACGFLKTDKGLLYYLG